MTRNQFFEIVQSRVARAAVGASTARGRGNKGVVAAARAFLRKLDLRPFTSSLTAFRRELDASTVALCSALPEPAAHWGLARKILNIFLRDCLYNTYLSAFYGLARVEEALELPLDSITAKQLRRCSGRGKLPTWPGVRHLDLPLSAEFQEAAAAEAGSRCIARVHLDAVWWSQSRDGDAA